MTRRPVTSGAAVSTLMFFGFGTAALAQTATQPSSTAYQAETSFYGRDRNTSVLERQRPDFEAVGIHQGGLTLYPSLDIQGTYNDNVFATSNSTKSDEFFTIKPSILAESNWGRHGLRLYANIVNEDYVRFSSENELGYTVQADGRIDVHGESTINLGVSAERLYEPRGNIYAISNTVNPVRFDDQQAYVRGSYVQDRIRITGSGAFQIFEFANDTLIGGGLVDENQRNEESGNGSGRIDYALTPDTAVFGSGTVVVTKYLNGPTIERRDSKTYEGLAGVNFDITALARGEVGVGYFERNYDNSNYASISGISLGAKVEYFPTPLMTVTLLGQRRPQDAAFINSSGFFQNSVSLGVDYEVRRNWIASAEAGYEKDDFESVSRHDQVANVVVSSRYYVSRGVGVGGSVTYANRSSTGEFQGPSFKDTTVGVFIVFQR